ncbi:hypothetical protein LCGC14_1092910 [marine sediment metagenome]|uniref:Holin n=1 Tax=marine sediment metagenome TaxID=412755 RepID=A0A0F9MBX7_9ZZZZ
MFMLMLLVLVVPLMAQGDDSTGFQWWPIITGVLGVLSAVLGKFVVDGKKKLGKIVNLGIQTVEALDAGVDLADYTLGAAADNVFTNEEKEQMKAKALKFKNEKADVKAAWKFLWFKVPKVEN